MEFDLKDQNKMRINGWMVKRQNYERTLHFSHLNDGQMEMDTKKCW